MVHIKLKFDLCYWEVLYSNPISINHPKKSGARNVTSKIKKMMNAIWEVLYSNPISINHQKKSGAKKIKKMMYAIGKCCTATQSV